MPKNLRRKNMATEQQHFDASRQFQAFYDDTLRRVGPRAPQPVLGQKVDDYRREALRTMKRTFLPPAHPLYQVQFRGLRSDALPVFEKQLLPACVEEANNPQHVPVGELRKVEELDEFGKLRMIRWIGQEHFTKAMGRPGRRIVSFSTDRGRFDASGRPLR
jgi:hypothetical protein